ncbi:tetratricopeptide repeat protein [Candidatus Trichorickettsia mobilis]|uniref:tetratricopeptide repeat protein n=1 Tax=Candidatus Trichorickettsia mobilis TaxID=1346319 RepID=UPI00292CE537|nr:tetratricopeptide repeat protein [Candidatus Trichorickettsia mobilis]
MSKLNLIFDHKNYNNYFSRQLRPQPPLSAKTSLPQDITRILPVSEQQQVVLTYLPAKVAATYLYDREQDMCYDLKRENWPSVLRSVTNIKEFNHITAAATTYARVSILSNGDFSLDLQPRLHGGMIEENEQDPKFWFGKGNKCYTVGKKEEAANCYITAIRLDNNYADAYTNLGAVFFELGKLDQAITLYTEAIRLNPSNDAAHHNKGFTLSELGKFDEAISCYSEAIRLKPNHPMYHYKKGAALSETGKYAEAVLCYDQVLNLDPNDADTYSVKGVALFKSGRYEEGKRCFDTVIKLYPNDPNNYNNKGNALHDLGNFDEAIECYDHAIDLDDNKSSYYYNKGVVLSRLGREKEAIKCYDIAINLDPSNVAYYNNKGNALKVLGKLEEALECCNMAINLSPENALYYCNRGKAFNSLGDSARALDDFNQAYRLAQEGKLNHLTKGNITHINETLDHDRNLLLKKLTELQESSIEVEQKLRRFKTFNISDRVVQENINKITQEFDQAKAEKTQAINDAVEAMDPKPHTAAQIALDADRLDELTERFVVMQRQLEALMTKNSELETEVKKIHEVLDAAGVREMAAVNQMLGSLKAEPKLYNYYTTAYWVLLNYIGAYRNLETGLIQGDAGSDRVEQAKAVSSAALGVVTSISTLATKAANYGTKLIEGVPLLGGAIKLIDVMISDAYHAYKNEKSSQRQSIINSLVRTYSTDGHLSIGIAKAVIAVVGAKKDQILHCEGHPKSYSAIL